MARQKFVEDNKLDYQLFNYAKRMIAANANEAGAVFANTLEQVQLIQAEINQLENPPVHSSMIFEVDEAFLARVQSVIRRFDLTPIEAYLEFAQSRQPEQADLFDGSVDAVQDGMVSGWTINLARPEQSVPIEVRIGTQVVASGRSGEYRPDVAAARYASSYTGFQFHCLPAFRTGFISQSQIRLSTCTMREPGDAAGTAPERPETTR